MKKPLIIGSAVIIGLLAGGVAYGWHIQSKAQEQVASVEEAPQEVAVEEKQWKDQAGFTFSYAADLIVDQHDEDQENYAHVELTHADHPGSLIVWVKDLPPSVADAASWVNKDKTLSAGVAQRASLGGEKAQRITLAAPTRTIVGTVYDELLWYIDVMPTDEAYWNGVFERVHTSFAFTQVTSEESTGQSDPGAVEAPVDEEEIVE